MSEKNKDFEKEVLRLEYCFEKGINLRDRVIQVTGVIDQGDFDYLDAALNEMERKSKAAITIRINSPGGSVYEALAMVGRMKKSKCQIITEGYGHIMSAAVLLLSGGDKRRISRYAWAMHHEASYIIGGTHSDVKEEIEQMEREENMWATWMEEFSTHDKEYWRDICRKKNFYLTADECIEHGIVDEVI